MTEMIERVARATFECRPYGDEDSERGIPTWETMGEEWREVHRTLARAAIEAMREPTNDMTVVGWKEAEKRDAVLGNGEIAIIFNAMIDAALGKEPDDALSRATNHTERA